MLLCATVLLGAALMYRVVERPFRRRWQAEFHWRPRSVAAVAFTDRDLIVWGDIHALHLVAGLSEIYPDLNVCTLYQTGCTPQSGIAGYVRNLADDYSTEACIDYNKRALSFLSSYRPANVILTNAKSSTPAVIAPPTEFLIRQLRAHGDDAFVLRRFHPPWRRYQRLPQCA